MRTGDKEQAIPLTSYEMATLCALSLEQTGVSVADLSRYMYMIGKMSPTSASLGHVLRRLEKLAWVSRVSKRLGDHDRGPREVSIWVLLNPGRDAIRAHDEWYQKITADKTGW